MREETRENVNNQTKVSSAHAILRERKGRVGEGYGRSGRGCGARADFPLERDRDLILH